ncbi:MAG: energy transducer TonB [Bryobacterales bacterium]
MRGACDFDELGSLTVATLHLPWYRSLLRQLRRDEPLPPIEATSKPVAVKPIWGAFDQHGRGLLYSTALHVAVVVLLFTGLSSPYLERAALHSIDLYVPVDAARLLTGLRNEIAGGGGGGLNSPLPVSRGTLPRFDVHHLAPAMLDPVDNPRLMVEPTLLGPRDIQVATLDLKWFGDPLAGVGPPSQGPGSGGGFGNEKGTGIGPDEGAGYGPGTGNGAGGVFRIGGGVSAPVLLLRVDPEYSQEARKARVQGTVVLLIEVWPDGRAHNIRLENGLGMGLDEQAIKAVEQWRFKPGMKNGAPVRVGARVEVHFRLL